MKEEGMAILNRKTVREMLDMGLSEADFIEQVIELSHIYHWKCAHFRPARTATGWKTPVAGDGAGFPDLVLVHEGRKELLWVELKSEKGSIRPEQREWHRALRIIGERVYVWRPSQWQQLEEVLKG